MSLSADGVSADPSKIATMEQWPIPRNLKELRGFLGQDIIESLSRIMVTIAHHLTWQIKKESFASTVGATKAFHKLKTAMATTLVLRIPEFLKEFVIEVDASRVGVGVVMQDSQPIAIAFFNRTLPPLHLAKVVYERELTLM